MMIDVKERKGGVLIGGRMHTAEEARCVIASIEDAMPQEFNEDGMPVCPKCGMEADEDRPDFWVCAQIECNGFHQTVYEGDPRGRDED